MNRPTYETPENLAMEQAVADRICQWASVVMVKLSAKYPFDRAIIHDHQITGFVEIKCRRVKSTEYRDYLLSAAKFFHALQWKKLSGIPCFLAVQWEDKLGYHEIDPDKTYECRLAGRKDRGDDQDMEPCFFIPISWFKIIPEIVLDREVEAAMVETP